MTKTRRERSPLSEHLRTWERNLQWVDENVRSLVVAIDRKIRNDFPRMFGRPRGRYYCYYRGKPVTKSIFGAFVLTHDYLKIRIMTDPGTFHDRRKWTKEKIFRNWFFARGQEREFVLTDKKQIEYAMKLLRHSYNLAIEIKK